MINFRSAISLTLIAFSIFIYSIFNLNFKNIISFESRVKNYVNLGDKFFLPENQNLLIKRYNDLTTKDECVLIFTYESAIPYLLKKPSCNKYYFVHTIGSKENQNLFIKSVENRKPNFILLGGEYINIGLGPEPNEMFPIIYNFLLENYQLYENISRWNIYKLKLP
jgi:hypothetical protein